MSRQKCYTPDILDVINGRISLNIKDKIPIFSVSVQYYEKEIMS